MDLRLELVNTLSITAVTASIVMMARTFDKPLDPGLAGIAIKAILGNMMYLGFAMMNLSMLEANMNAVERVQQFTDKDYVPQERPRKSGLPPTNWPQQGRIELNSISCHYGDASLSAEDIERLPEEDRPQLVLKQLKASIGAREKIGVVGRTGAGKSSLMSKCRRSFAALPERVSQVTAAQTRCSGCWRRRTAAS